MYLNEYAADLTALDMTQFDEFQSLLRSAEDLEIPHSPDVRYRSRNTVIQNLRIHFLEWGDPAAPPLLLVHGGNQSAHSWDLVSLHLADRFHVYALDQRGHGDSEWARDADYAVDTLAADLRAFIVQQGMLNPIIIAHSLGGLATITLTLQSPSLPRALVIVDTGPETSQSGSQTVRNFITANAEFDSIDQFVDRVTTYDPYRSAEHVQRTVRYNLVARADGRYIAKSDRMLHDSDFMRRLPIGARDFTLDNVTAITCPTLVVRGGESEILEPDAAERFAAALPDGALVTVPHCGHNVHSQNTLAFLAAVREFLEAL